MAGGAKSGAILLDGELVAELREIIYAWPHFSREARADVLALARFWRAKK